MAQILQYQNGKMIPFQVENQMVDHFYSSYEKLSTEYSLNSGSNTNASVNKKLYKILKDGLVALEPMAIITGLWLMVYISNI